MRCLQMVSLTLTPAIKWLRLHCLKEERKRKEDNWKKSLLMLEILDVHQILAVPPMNLTLKINRRQICLMTFPEFQGIRSWIIDLFILVCGCTWHPFGRRHFQWTRLTAIKLASVKLINIVKVITNRRVWALVPNKLVELGNAVASGGGLHGNPASGPHQALSHWTIQWNTDRCTTYLAHASRGREGWENQSRNYYANGRLLQSLGKNCERETAYVSHKVPLLATSDHS